MQHAGCRSPTSAIDLVPGASGVAYQVRFGSVGLVRFNGQSGAYSEYCSRFQQERPACQNLVKPTPEAHRSHSSGELTRKELRWGSPVSDSGASGRLRAPAVRGSNCKNRCLGCW